MLYIFIVSASLGSLVSAEMMTINYSSVKTKSVILVTVIIAKEDLPKESHLLISGHEIFTVNPVS